jgi:aminomethyltransferase
MSELQTTALYQSHVDLGAKMVPFAGYSMPVQYSSVVKETKAVRSNCGIFDASHMGEIWVEGPNALAELNRLTTNQLETVATDQARYTLMLNADGGVIDDLIIYRLGEEEWMVVCNAANHAPVLAHLQTELSGKEGVSLHDESDKLSLLAVQGPNARVIVGKIIDLEPEDFPRRFRWMRCGQGDSWIMGRTGYTGEDGVELFVPNADAPELLQRLLDLGAEPAGLGARDVCRVEAGLPLYGHEMNMEVGPREASLMFAVKMDKDFVGKQALEGESEQVLMGLVMEGRGVPREGYPVFQNDQEVGVVTSGTHSPHLEQGIAMARVSRTVDRASGFEVEIRGRRFPMKNHKLPFIHQFK